MANDVIKQHDRLIAKLKNLQDKDRFTRTVLIDLHNQIAQRIFIKGQAANDKNFTSGVKFKGKRDGDYSSGHARKRKKIGLGIDVVNLRFTNELEGDFSFIVEKRTEGGDQVYGHGFKKARTDGKQIHNADLSRHLEKIYNKQIFKLSASELKKLRDKLGKHVKIELK